MSTSYQPKLSRIIKSVSVPEFFAGPTSSLDNFLNDIYIKNLIISNSVAGDVGYYYLDLAIDKTIGFSIPGTGMTLSLNPPPNSTITHPEWTTLNDTPSPYKSYPIELMNFTDNSEIEFVIDKFLNWLKNEFDNE